MGTLHVPCQVQNHVDRSKKVRVMKALVDTGSEYTWVPADKLAKIGVAREKKDIQFAMANAFTIDEVVFAEPGDQTILGARMLEGLNLRVDPGRKKLVAARPLPAA